MLRRTLNETLPNAELRVQTMSGALAPEFRPWKLGAFLFGLLGALALTVAVFGLFGVIAYGVRRRTHEMGIRVALGAQRAKILGMVVREAVVIVGVSVAAGLLTAVAVARFVGSLLYDTSPADPSVVSGVVIVMLAVGVVAALAPAVRASRVDPMVALRAE
jgi:ABC-type antimicrobial peptide transport system permease subunit